MSIYTFWTVAWVVNLMLLCRVWATCRMACRVAL